MSGAAEARDVAALSLKLQTDLHLKPHKAARVAKLLGAEAPALLHAPSDALSATVERVGARIRPEDLFSPVRVAAASRSSTSAALDATAGRRDLSSSSASGFGATGGVSARGAAGGTTGALRATGGRLAAPGLDPLKGRTLLSELPPAPRRRRSKEDVWTELSRADADAAVKEAAARKQLDAVGRARYQAGLATQLEQQRAARAEAARKEADYAASMDAATAEFRRQQREAAAARAAAAAALSAEAREAQDALAAAREAAKAARLEEERHALERIKATERAAAAKAAARKVEEAERVARWLADNKAEMAAKRAAAVAQRDADVRMLAEAARVAEEKERRRLEEVAARDAAIKAKLESMKEIFVNAAAAEAEAQARADRERIAVSYSPSLLLGALPICTTLCSAAAPGCAAPSCSHSNHSNSDPSYRTIHSDLVLVLSLPLLSLPCAVREEAGRGCGSACGAAGGIPCRRQAQPGGASG